MNEIMRLLNVDPLLLQALREDMPSEDVSTNAVMPCACPGTVDLIAKQDGIVAGLDVFARVFTCWTPPPRSSSSARMAMRSKTARSSALSTAISASCSPASAWR